MQKYEIAIISLCIGFSCGCVVAIHAFQGIAQKNVFRCLDQHTLHECQIKYDAVK